MKKIRIGSGAGYAGDRLEPALDLMQKGNLNYICFECLAERTIALAQKDRLNNPKKGYNPLFEARMNQVLPLAYKKKIKVITNMGAANPLEALKTASRIASRHGLSGMKIIAVLGDEVLNLVKTMPETKILENGNPLSSLKGRLLSANAYLGSEPIVQALANGADVVITGRVADPSLFLAPMIFEFNWAPNDFDLLGKGTLVGHLLECAGQISGGYFADSQKKKVPELWDLGFPLVELDQYCQGFITKTSGSGGIISTASCKEQLLYEIHDPSAYMTPDCIADFSKVAFKENGLNKVSFEGATGYKATDSYKVSVGYTNGYLGEGQIGYYGSGALERAQLSAQIVEDRLKNLGVQKLHFDFIGYNSLGPSNKKSTGHEIFLRVAGWSNSKEEAILIGNEVEALYTNGPYGGGGAMKRVEELISIASVFVPKNAVKTELISQKI